MKTNLTRSVWIGLLAGLILSIPLTFFLINTKSKNRGVVVNHWRVSFRTGDYGNNYLLRAAIAVHSLGNAIPEEAMFFHGFYDHQGEILNGANDYSVHFEPENLPPVDAFWSLTVYSEDGYLVDNPIGRYNISDRTEGLQYEEDGSLIIYFSVKEPATGSENWLPVKDGVFTVTLRTYLPTEKLLNLTWEPPPIIRKESD